MDVDDDNSDDNLNNDTPEARLSLLSQGGSLGASGPNDSRLSCSWATWSRWWLQCWWREWQWLWLWLRMGQVSKALLKSREPVYFSEQPTSWNPQGLLGQLRSLLWRFAINSLHCLHILRLLGTLRTKRPPWQVVLGMPRCTNIAVFLILLKRRRNRGEGVKHMFKKNC